MFSLLLLHAENATDDDAVVQNSIYSIEQIFTAYFLFLHIHTPCRYFARRFLLLQDKITIERREEGKKMTTHHHIGSNQM